MTGKTLLILVEGVEGFGPRPVQGAQPVGNVSAPCRGCNISFTLSRRRLVR